MVSMVETEQNPFLASLNVDFFQIFSVSLFVWEQTVNLGFCYFFSPVRIRIRAASGSELQYFNSDLQHGRFVLVPISSYFTGLPTVCCMFTLFIGPWGGQFFFFLFFYCLGLFFVGSRQKSGLLLLLLSPGIQRYGGINPGVLAQFYIYILCIANRHKSGL